MGRRRKGKEENGGERRGDRIRRRVGNRRGEGEP